MQPPREKKLTPVHRKAPASPTDLIPAAKISLERAIDYITADELLEVTPKSLRLRKCIPNNNERPKARKSGK